MSQQVRTSHGVHTWGECPKRLKTTATVPPSPMPHNCLARTCPAGQGSQCAGGCSCAWCGESAPLPAGQGIERTTEDRWQFSQDMARIARARAQADDRAAR